MYAYIHMHISGQPETVLFEHRQGDNLDRERAQVRDHVDGRGRDGVRPALNFTWSKF